MLIEIEAEIRHTSKPNKVLHFVKLRVLRAGLLPRIYYRIILTMLFFRNIITAQLFLSRVRIVQVYLELVTANVIAFASTVLDLPLGCAKLVCFCYKLIFNARWQP